MSQERVAWAALGQEVLGLAPRLWIEVIDRHHRYATLLYEYWRRWEVSDTEDHFFEWLSTGQGSLIDLPHSPRRLLDEWQVVYLTRPQQELFRVLVEPGTGRFRWAMDGTPVTTPTPLQLPVCGRHVQDLHSPDLPVLPEASTAREAKIGELLAPRLSLSCYRDRLLREAKEKTESYMAAGTEATPVLMSELAGPLIAEGLLCQLRDPFFKERQDASTIRDGHAHLRSMPQLPATLLPNLDWKDMLAAIDHDQGIHMKNPFAEGKARADGKGIFVLNGLGNLYCGTKLRGVFHHSSFVRGHCVKVAGGIHIVDGWLQQLSPHSGHYQPAEEHVENMIAAWKENGVDFATVEIKAYLKTK